MKIDLIALMAFIALALGVFLVFSPRGGGGGGSDVATPSTRAPQGGGWLPGYTRNNYRNGGVGATSAEVWYN